MASSDEMAVYQEGNRLAIAYSQLMMMASSLFMSASFTIFGISFTIKNFWALVLMAVASVMLYSMFLVYLDRYRTYTHEIIFPRLQKFEKETNMKMKFHTDIHSYDMQKKKECWLNYTVRRIRVWNVGVFPLLIILWLVRIFFSSIL